MRRSLLVPGASLWLDAKAGMAASAASRARPRKRVRRYDMVRLPSGLRGGADGGAIGRDVRPRLLRNPGSLRGLPRQPPYGAEPAVDEGLNPTTCGMHPEDRIRHPRTPPLPPSRRNSWSVRSPDP